MKREIIYGMTAMVQELETASAILTASEDDQSRVAVLLTQADLMSLIRALRQIELSFTSYDIERCAKQMRDDLERLCKETFPK